MEKEKKFRNRKTKVVEDTGLKPKHTPYRREAHHSYLLDDMDVYDPPYPEGEDEEDCR